ncbi:MAG: imidazole glycerol phosphate synthase subunit HisH [Selenomonadaceae bacterium]|nr:imidazole glycerol phosphate synthase subunit HisH [Selenomonadaceae bacterium]
MIAIIDYGVGNLFSVEKAFASIGEEVKVTGSADDLRAADKLVLPGVGAFGDCMKNLESTGLIPIIKEQVANKKNLFGICVGLQILFENSEESPGVSGLGILKGTIKKINAPQLKIPHMGWNFLIKNAECRMQNDFLNGLDRSYFYFVHSYHAVPEDKNLIAATTDYGETLTAAIAYENIFATQFHPEKSGDVGLKLLKNFCDWKA